MIGVMPVVRHAIQQLQEADILIRELCLIYTAAPFLRINDLKKGRDSLRSESCDYVIAVTTFAFPIQRAVKKTANGQLAMFQPENFNSRSQDLDSAYHDAAQFCWGTTKAWLEERPMYASNTIPIEIPRYLVQDIDSEEDWRSAEWMFKALRGAG